MATIERRVLKFYFLARRLAIAAVFVSAPTAVYAQADSSTPVYMREFDGFRSKVLEKRVQEMADREEIKELTARYAQRIAAGISAADLFTDDGVFISRTPDGAIHEARGREQLVKAYADILSKPEYLLPTIHNYIISISGNTAVERCWIELHTKVNGQNFDGSGFYEDKLLRVNGRWKFTVRDSTLVKWGAVP